MRCSGEPRRHIGKREAALYQWEPLRGKPTEREKQVSMAGSHARSVTTWFSRDPPAHARGQTARDETLVLYSVGRDLSHLPTQSPRRFRRGLADQTTV